MRFTFAVSAVAITTSAVSNLVSARAPSKLFGVARTTSFGQNNGLVKSQSKSVLADPLSIARGGDDDGDDEAAGVEAETLYLPGLLEASVKGKGSISDAATDYTITISPSKAKELGVKSGDVVAIIGRRRRASYVMVKVAKMSSSSVGLRYNLASNLRVRDTDKVKIVPLDGNVEDEEAYGTGDMALVTSQPELASSVTFSPVKDSLHSLELSEGGDELSEDEIMERFVVPYLNVEDAGEIVLKEGHTLVLMDANKVSLEFTVSHLGMGAEDDEVDAEEQGKRGSYPVLFNVVLSV